MKRKISITAKIFSGFVLIIILSSLFLIISYPLLSRIQRLSQSTVLLAELTRRVESIEHANNELNAQIETYLEVGSKTSQKKIEKKLRKMVEDSSKSLEQTIVTEDEKVLFQKLHEHILIIQNDIEELFHIKEKRLSSYLSNRKLIAVLNSETTINGLLEKILSQNMLMLEEKVSVQRYEIRNLLRYFLLIELGIILFGIAIAAFLSRFIVASLHKLQEYTRAVSRGSFSTKIDIDSSDEIGDLAVSFKKMTENLKKTTTSISNLNQEIAERKKVEEELKAAEKKNRTWLENSPVCTKIVDLDFNLQYMSAAGVRDLKINDITQFYGKPYPFDFYPESFRNTMIKNLKKVKEKGEIITQEASVVDIKGDKLWYHSTLVPVNKDDGQIDYIIVVSMEITGRKRAEKKLRESEESFIHAQRIAHLGNWNWNIVDNTEVWSDEQYRIFGYQPGEIEPTYQHFLDALHPEDREKVIAAVKAAIDQDVPFDIEYRIIRPDKSERGIHAQGQVMRDLKKRPVRMVGTVLDITERKKAERKMRESAELKTKFAATVSHELRTPLALIKEGISLVLDEISGPVNKKQRNLLVTVKDNTDRLGRLIDNTLDFQKLEKGMMKLRIENYDINEVVKETTKAMSVVVIGKGLKLFTKLEPDLNKIRFDRDKIVQVLTNLINNSIKFTEKGSITLRTKKEDNVISVMVEDTGVGIKNEDISKIFQSFHQLEQSEETRAGGTGLGLAICKEIIMHHGGKIWVKSEIGKGSIFQFVLPIENRRG